MAALDTVGVVADAVALALPVIPGGAGAAIRASRAAKMGIDALQTADQAINVGQGAAQAIDEYQQGNYGWSSFYAGMSAMGVRGLGAKGSELSKDIRNLSEAEKAGVKLEAHSGDLAAPAPTQKAPETPQPLDNTVKPAPAVGANAAAPAAGKSSVGPSPSSATPAAGMPEVSPAASSSVSPGIASGEVRFKKWKRGEAIDKPLPDGSSPSWDVVQSRYWKNRYEAVKNTNEFDPDNLDRMRRGNAPLDYNPRTGEFEPRELHHVTAQQYNGPNSPLNIRELTPDWHAEVDAFRQRPGIQTTRGIR
jgi:hypothetical protein